MSMRRLGHTNLMTFPLIFGGNVLGWTLDTPSSFAVLDAFVGAGGNMVDTADVYSRWVEGNQGGESESILGQWMKLQPRATVDCHQSWHGHGRRRQRFEPQSH